MPYDTNKAVKYLAHNYGNKKVATGKCARAVREALEAGGLDTNTRPVSAKDYGPFLTARGFSP